MRRIVTARSMLLGLAVLFLTACPTGAAEVPEGVLPQAPAKATQDVGKAGPPTYGNLPDPGDEYTWTVGDAPEGVYYVEVDVRSGSRGEGTDFIRSYRLGAPAGAFPSGTRPEPVTFVLPAGEKPVVASKGEGYSVFRAWIRSERKLFLRPGDALSLTSTAHYAKAEGLRLRPVPESEQWDLHLTTAKPANLFRKGEAVEVRASVTNWRARTARWRVGYVLRDLEGKTLAEGGQAASVPARTAAGVTLKPRAERLGPLFLEARIEEEGKLVGSREIALGNSPAPDPKRAPASSPFGIHKSDLSEWPSIGVKWNRLWDTGDTWNRYERERGVIEWEGLDRKVAEAERLGVKLLYVFAYTPTWASSRPEEPHYTGGGARAPAKDLADWRRFVRAVVERYRGRMEHFEIWNEPNAGFFTGTPDDYVALLKSAYEEVKAANPKAVVVGISGTGGYLEWMEEVFKRGGLRHMDVVSVHTYTSPSSPEQANLAGRLRATRELIAKYGGKQPIWNTEVGIWSPERESARPLPVEAIAAKAPKEIAPNWQAGWPYRPIDELAAARHCVRLHAISLANGLERIFWYSWVAQAFPMYNVDGSARLLSIAYGQMAAALGEARFLKRLDLGAGDLYAYVFTTPSGPLALLWSTHDTPRRIALPAGGKPVLRDLWGNAMAPEGKGGELLLALDESPLYLEGIPLTDLEKAHLSGEEVFLAAVDAVPGPDAGQGGPPKEATSPPHHGKRRVMSLPDAGDSLVWTVKGVPAGRYAVALEARSGSRAPGGEMVGAYLLRVEPASGAAPREVRFAVAPDAPPEETHRAEKWSLFYARMPGSEPVTLHPGDRLVLESKGGALFAAGLHLRLVGDAREEPVACPRRAQPPVLDGRLDDWPGTPLFRLSERRQMALGVADAFASTSERDAWKGPDDLSAAGHAAWDDTWLYLALRVTDDAIVPPLKIQSAWSADAVEVWLDLRAPEQVGSPVLGEGVYHFWAAPPAGDGTAAELGGRAPEGTEVVVVRAEGGYVFEARIPWRSVPGFRPQAGRAFGFDVGVDDADDAPEGKPRRKAQIIWHGRANNFQDPSAYGRLVLSGRK